MIKAFEQRRRSLANSARIPALDYWRAIAILAVVLYHAKLLPVGYVGVDLFFVLSGYLVSRYLVDRGASVEFSVATNFVAARAFKIWPSYFFFLLVGSLFSYLLYGASYPGAVINGSDWFKYLLFYQNYRGTEYYIFDHVWSICVEEHFYILLPLTFLFWAKYFSKLPIQYVFFAMILIGNALRAMGFLVGFETFIATHNRLDALGWGVLLYSLESRGMLERWKKPIIAFLGLALLVAIFILEKNTPPFFKQLIFHGLTPVAFFLMLTGTVAIKFDCLHWLRMISYYSYNWYLWHMLLYYKLAVSWQFSPAGMLAYLASGFLLAVVATHLVEEPGLALRSRWLKK